MSEFPLRRRLRLIPPQQVQPVWRRLAFGTGCGLLAVLVRLPVEPVLAGSVPFVFFLPGVTVAAVRTGAVGAAPAVLIGVAYFLIRAPVLSQFQLAAGLPFLLFLVSSGLVIAVAEELRTAMAELTRREEALTRSEARLKLERHTLEAIFQIAPVGLSLSEAGTGRSILANEELVRIMGRDISGSDLGRYEEAGAIHADGAPYDVEDYPSVLALGQGRATRAATMTIRRPDGGRVRTEVSSTPLRDGDGAVVAAVTVVVDIEAREQALEHQQLLTGELAHRMKNTLSIVQAIVSQTLRSASSMDVARLEVMERLSALSRAQDALTRTHWRSATLGDTIDAALAPLTLGPERLSRSGPEVGIGSRAALSFTLALHELATNAVKYGALSAPGGRIELSWTLADGPRGEVLCFIWNERDGPTVVAPTRQGFGSRLMQSVSRTFSGDSTLTYDPAGLCWKVTATTEALQAF